MSTKIDRSVGLLIMTKIVLPGRKEPELVAVLQRRGEFDHEKRQSETWPGICQLTAHGRLKEAEDWEEGLIREVMEELGGEFWPMLASHGIGWDRLTILPGTDDSGSTVQVRNFGIFLDHSFLHCVRLRSSTGGLRFIGRNQRIEHTQPEQKTLGVAGREVFMFPGDADAVRHAFKIFRQ